MNRTERENATRGHTGDHMADLLPKAQWLCRAVAGSDLGQVPLYIVPQSILSGEFGAGADCYGYTTPSLDLYLREYITHWQGRGPCMVINDVAVRREQFEEDYEYLMLAHVLHELAHILDRPALFEDRTDVDPMRLAFERLVVARATRHPVRTDVPAHFGHEQSFIRIALHLCHRAQRHDVSIAPSVVCAGYQYGLSHASRYQQALGDEPAQCRSMPVRSVLAATPPAAFLSLWEQDLGAYHQRFPLPQGAQI